jgi:hypothetical protein
MSKPLSWSHTALKDYEGCPRRYHEVRVLKKYPFQETEATRYGNDLHKAVELYIKDNTAIPEQYAFVQPVVDALLKKPGRKLAEQKMAVTVDLKPCDWFDKGAWSRGIADLLIIDDENLTARVVDYKTGKSSRFADTKQLEILSLAMFKHFPEVKEIKAGLLFLVAEDLVKISYETSAQPTRWVKWLNDTKQLEAAYENGVWNPKPNFSCKQYCAVTSCIYNGKNH